MAKDPRKMSAFESGMRGRETPKTKRAAGKANGEADLKLVQDTAPGKADAYSSGMRGMETESSKSPDTVPAGAPRRRAEDKTDPAAAAASTFSDVEESDLPAGSDGHGQTMSSETARGRAEAAYQLGTPGNNTEAAAAGDQPWAEEDDTHINIRVPKASLKKKPGLQGS